MTDAVHEGAHLTTKQWALLTSVAFALTVGAHELAHAAVGAAVGRDTPDARSVRALAGPAASLLLMTGSALWLRMGEVAARTRRWVVATGLSAAARVLFVWVLAAPFLLGLWTRVTFDELVVARWLAVPVGIVLLVETLLALYGTALLLHAIPREERRAALRGMAVGIVATGFAVMLIDVRI